jgi:hypothetical protein
VKIILDTDSTNPEYNGGCDCAVVDLSPAVLSTIRNRVRLAQQLRLHDDDLYELYFWGCFADFYNRGLKDACEEAIAAAAEKAGLDETTAVGNWIADFDANGHALLPKGVNLAKHDAEPTECDQLIIRVCPSKPPRIEVAWLASPRHSDVYVTTRDLPLTGMEAYARGKVPTREEVFR